MSASRTMALTKNLQMAGIANVLVTAETPERLAEVFPAAFDKILVDAPCSGEGMFRREPRMMSDWREKGPEMYAPLQREILAQAYRMLKPGGRLVYSTCTFSVAEDEEVVNWFLETYPDMSICRVETREGFSPGRKDMVEHSEKDLENCVRIFPHRAPGEGHFAVLLRKGSEGALPEKTVQDDRDIPGGRVLPGVVSGAGDAYKKVRGIDLLRGDKRLERKLGEAWGDVRDFLEQVMIPDGILTYERDTLFWHSRREPEHKGLRVMYGGLPVCRWRHKVQPSPQLALILQAEDYDNVLSFQCGEEQVIRYLKGETLQVAEGIKGNVLVCLEGYGLGWAQGNGRGLLKNKYHPGWRYQ